MKIKEKVNKILKTIEEHHNVRIIYAAESGSRAWGFNSKDSDYDIRFFYVSTQEYYNTIYPINYSKFTLDKNSSKVISNINDDTLDFVGHDVKKALYLISKGNPDIISWLYSPHIYFAGKDSLLILDRAQKFFSTQAGIYHFVHMASKNFNQYILNKKTPKLKKYLYVIRPLICCYYIEYRSMPPTTDFIRCLDFMNEILIEKGYSDVLLEIYKLIDSKITGDELSEGEANPILNKFCINSIEYFKNLKHTTPIRGKYLELDALFNKLIKK